MVNVLGYLTTNDPNVLLTTVMLPFLLIFVILWGALNTFKLFDRKVNIVIALVITIFAAFTDAWGLIATQLAAFTGVFVYVMFFAVFIIGTVIWAISRTRSIHEMHWSAGHDYRSVKMIDKERGKLAKKYRELKEAGRDQEANAILSTIAMLDKKKEEIILGKQIQQGV